MEFGYVCLHPFASLTVPPPPLLNYFCPTLPCSFVPIPPITYPHLTLWRPTSMLKAPQAIFRIRVTMFALLHLLHIAPPLCPHFLDFSLIDPSACRMGLIHKHRCLSCNRTPQTNQPSMSVILEISIFSGIKIQIQIFFCHSTMNIILQISHLCL